MSHSNFFVAGLILSVFASQPVLGQTLSEQARSSGGVPVRTVLLEDVPKTGIEELAGGADVVVRATIIQPKSYLTPDDRYVLTDYVLTNAQVVAGSFPAFLSPVPGKASPIILVLNGGKVLVNGTPVIAENATMAEELKDGAEYLLFLKKLGSEPGRYRPFRYGIFRIEGGHARAVIKQAKEIFPGASEAPLADLVSRIAGRVVK